MRTKPLVTATEYGVSTTSGSGIDGVSLDIYKRVPREATPDSPLRFEMVYAVKAMPFADGDAADAYCLQHGWLKEYESKL